MQTKDLIYIKDIEVKQGKYGPYITVSGKHYGPIQLLDIHQEKLSIN